MTTIDDLNHHCLSEILSYIDVKARIKCREVSKKFLEASDACWVGVKEVKITFASVVEESDLDSDDDSSEWVSDDENNDVEPGLSGTNPTIKIRTPGQKLIEHVFKRCGEFITTLKEERHMQEEKTFLPLAIKYCPKIEQLCTAVITKKDDKNVKKLLSNINKLKYLELRINLPKAKLWSHNISTDNLKRLHLMTWECHNPYIEILECQKKVISRCSSSVLKSLTIDTFDDKMLEIVGQMKKLERLELRFIHTVGLTQNGLNHILKLKNLKEFGCIARPRQYRKDNSHNPPVTDDFLMALSDNLPLLVAIDIEAPRDVTDDGFKSLASLEKLERLRVTECGDLYDDGVIELINEAKKLRVLSVDYSSITDNTLIAAYRATEMRKNGIPLILSVAGTCASPEDLLLSSPRLRIVGYDDDDDDDDYLFDYLSN